MTEKILKEIDKKLKAILIALALKEGKTNDKIKVLCVGGLKSEEIGGIIGLTGRAVRNNEAYKE